MTPDARRATAGSNDGDATFAAIAAALLSQAPGLRDEFGHLIGAAVVTTDTSALQPGRAGAARSTNHDGSKSGTRNKAVYSKVVRPDVAM